MDKWFTLQGANPAKEALANVRALLNRSFSMSNPNRVRSLVGAFTAGIPLISMRKIAVVTNSCMKF